MSIAIINGEALLTSPKDLYIPPDALEIFLEMFQGPLDLLLYLIKRQNLDILNIQIAEITRQYMGYIELMQTLRLELAAEYLVMAAVLAEIKSRMLLPKPKSLEGEEAEDPRAELIRRLREYERYRQAAEKLDQLPRSGRDFFPASAVLPEIGQTTVIPTLDWRELFLAFNAVLTRLSMTTHHQIQREPLSIRERMSRILAQLREQPTTGFREFGELFTIEEGRKGVVVTFIAILELLKQSLISVVQTENFSPIHIKLIKPI